MSTTNTTIDTAAMKAKIAHMQDVLEGRYKPEEAEAEIGKTEKALGEIAETLLKLKVARFDHFRLADIALPDFKPKIENNEVHLKVRMALSALQGASGTTLADFIGDYRIDSVRIEQFRRERYLLKRTGEGTNTLYSLATPDETRTMQEEALKEAEAAEEAERAAKQVVIKAKATAKKKKGK
jgi:hypothetical protein